MKALIEISNKTIGAQAVQSVLAKDLYLGLGLASAVWSRWSQSNIVENGFFTQDVDWARFNTMLNPTNGLPIEDFAITIDFAKHIAMMAKTEKAHVYRNYFLECEKQVRYGLVQQPAYVLPTNFVEALEMLVVSTKENIVLTAQIEADAPKVNFANVVSESSNSRCIRVWVKAMKNESNLMAGEQQVFEWLREHNYIYRDKNGWLPRSRHESTGTNYFCISLEEKNGKVFRSMKITGKGVVNLTEKVIGYFKPLRNGLVALS